MSDSLVGIVVNGAYTKTTASTEATESSSSTSTSKTASSGSTEYDQDMFLQLLIAEMQYQDPLEPTNNSEYVSQLASFTTIDAIQAVQSDMQTIQANSLVGKYVIVNDDGEYISGKVDYVTTDDDGVLQVAVGDSLYSIDTIDSVVEGDYYNAVLAAETFADTVSSLPALSELTLSDAEDVAEARALYDAMDSYTLGYVNTSSVETLEALEARIAALKESSTSTDDSTEETTEDDSTDEVEETDG